MFVGRSVAAIMCHMLTAIGPYVRSCESLSEAFALMHHVITCIKQCLFMTLTVTTRTLPVFHAKIHPIHGINSYQVD